MEHNSLNDIIPANDVYKTVLSKTTIHVLEKEGKFPPRHYLDADSPHPRKPFWFRYQIEEWLAARVRQSEEARAKAGLMGARLVQARHVKSA